MDDRYCACIWTGGQLARCRLPKFLRAIADADVALEWGEAPFRPASEADLLAAFDAAADDWFGFSVALSGDTAVVGVRFDDHAGGTDAGSGDACNYTPLGAPIIDDLTSCLYGTLREDLDGDCDVDLEDYAIFAGKLTGTSGG